MYKADALLATKLCYGEDGEDKVTQEDDGYEDDLQHECTAPPRRPDAPFLGLSAVVHPWKPLRELVPIGKPAGAKLFSALDFSVLNLSKGRLRC